MFNFSGIVGRIKEHAVVANYCSPKLITPISHISPQECNAHNRKERTATKLAFARTGAHPLAILHSVLIIGSYRVQHFDFRLVIISV